LAVVSMNDAELSPNAAGSEALALALLAMQGRPT
jgi:hypothetical protein